MRFIKKSLIALAVIAVLGGGLYFVFEQPWGSEAKRNPLLDLVFGGEETEEGLISGSKKFIEEQATAAKESVKEGIEKKESQILDSFKESVNEAIDSAQEKIIGVSGGGGNIRVVPVAKSGEQAYFLLSNPDPTKEVGYEVSWGDGETESGILAGESKTVSHSWSGEGEFTVSFKILGSNTSESVKVVVTE